MAIHITQLDLLQFFYGEGDDTTIAHIKLNIDYNPEWSNYLCTLSEINFELDKLMINPNPTTVSIILEETDSKLYQSI